MLNHCHPLPPRWPWRWIGPRSGATAAPKVPACFNKTLSSSSSTCCDETNGMVQLHLRVSTTRHRAVDTALGNYHDFRLNELRAEPRSRLACCPFRANNFHLRVSTTRHRAVDPPSSHPLAAKTQPEHSKSTTRAQPERSQSAARVQPEHRQSTARAQPEHRRRLEGLSTQRKRKKTKTAHRKPPQHHGLTFRHPTGELSRGAVTIPMLRSPTIN